jgi:hypothetical protein
MVNVIDELKSRVTRVVGSWDELSHLIGSHCDGDWIFRGVRNAEYPLIPKIGRRESRKDPNTGEPAPFSAADERKMMDEFRRIGRPHLPEYSISELEVLAIGQHHGLPTRLLDWSESPLVAAYFAAENAGVGFHPPGIYAVSGLPQLKGDEDPYDLRTVSIYRPPHVSPRIPAQRAIFTVHTAPEREELEPPRVELWQLSKTRETFWLKRILDRCGVNRASLFHDLDGLAAQLGWRYKWGL